MWGTVCRFSFKLSFLKALHENLCFATIMLDERVRVLQSKVYKFPVSESGMLRNGFSIADFSNRIGEIHSKSKASGCEGCHD